MNEPRKSPTQAGGQGGAQQGDGRDIDLASLYHEIETFVNAPNKVCSAMPEPDRDQAWLIGVELMRLSARKPANSTARKVLQDACVPLLAYGAGRV